MLKTQLETEGAFPPEAERFLADIATLRELLAGRIPPAVEEVIDRDRVYWEEEADRWEPRNS